MVLVKSVEQLFSSANKDPHSSAAGGPLALQQRACMRTFEVLEIKMQALRKGLCATSARLYVLRMRPYNNGCVAGVIT